MVRLCNQFTVICFVCVCVCELNMFRMIELAVRCCLPCFQSWLSCQAVIWFHLEWDCGGSNWLVERTIERTDEMVQATKPTFHTQRNGKRTAKEWTKTKLTRKNNTRIDTQQNCRKVSDSIHFTLRIALLFCVFCQRSMNHCFENKCSVLYRYLFDVDVVIVLDAPKTQHSTHSTHTHALRSNWGPSFHSCFDISF